MKKFILILPIILLISCSPIKKLQRFHKKYPQLFEKKLDTIFLQDTIKINFPSQEIDTAVKYTQLFDTVRFTNNNITTTIWQINDTVYAKTYLSPNQYSYLYKKSIPYNKYELPEALNKLNFLEKYGPYILSFLVLVLFIWILILIVRSNKRKNN